MIDCETSAAAAAKAECIFIDKWLNEVISQSWLNQIKLLFNDQ